MVDSIRLSGDKTLPADSIQGPNWVCLEFDWHLWAFAVTLKERWEQSHQERNCSERHTLKEQRDVT